MKVVFFAEGGKEAGLGHLRRSSVLAEEFRKHGNEVIFMIRDENAREWVQKKYSNLQIKDLEEIEADLAVVDSYVLSNEEIEKFFKTKSKVGFADFDEIKEIFDITIAPTFTGEHEKVLKGVEYQIIEPKFAEYRRGKNPEELKKVLITLSGSTTEERLAEILEIFGEEKEITLILPEDFQYENAAIKILRNPESMGELFKESDLVITSGGQTIFELAITGTPTIVIAHSENQRNNIELIQRLEILEFAGWGDDKTSLQNAIKKLESVSARDEQTRKSLETMDFRGAERIYKKITNG